MRWIFIAIFIGILSTSQSFGQFGLEFSHLRDARNIAWGQAAVAASDGAAALHVNSAAIGGCEGYGIRGGSGQTLPLIYDIDALDFSAAGAVLPGLLGIGATMSTHNVDLGDITTDNSLLQLHGGYRVADWLDVGMAVARYTTRTDGLVRRDENNNIIAWDVGEKDETYDIGISARAKLHDLAVEGDAVIIGLQLVNLLDTRFGDAEMDIYGTTLDKTRHVRLGALWSIPLEPAEESRLKPRFLVGAGVTVARNAAGSTNQYPGITVGASVLDMVTLLMNYEDEVDTGEAYFPWYPVLRFGILTDLPVGAWLGMQQPLIVSLDYSFWEQQGDTGFLKRWRGDDNWSRNAFAIGVHYMP